MADERPDRSPGAPAQPDLFLGLGRQARERLWERGRSRTLAAGERLFAFGEDATHLYVIEQGLVALALPIEVAGEAREVVVEEQGPLATVGWSALVPPHRYTLSATAREETVVRAFSPGILTSYLETDPDAGWRLFRNLCALVGRRLVKVEAMWIREVSRAAEARLRGMR